MGRPVFKAAGSGVATTTTTLALVAPAMSAGDCMVAVICSSNNVASSGMDARWVSCVGVNNTAALRTEVYVMPNVLAADSGGTFNFTVNGTTLSFGVIVAYSSCATFQSATNDSNSANASSATVTWANYVQSSVIGLVLAIFTYDKNGVVDNGISAGTPTFTNRFLGNTAVGGTAAIGVYDGFTGAGQPTGARTLATGAVAAVNDGVFLELVGTMDGMGHATNDNITYPAIIRTQRY